MLTMTVGFGEIVDGRFVGKGLGLAELGGSGFTFNSIRHRVRLPVTPPGAVTDRLTRSTTRCR
jgi:hypothetical protein